MVKVIECGYLRAVVDITDINKPKMSVETITPVEVCEYHSNWDVWRWDADIAKDAKALYSMVDGFLFSERQRRRREKLCAVS